MNLRNCILIALVVSPLFLSGCSRRTLAEELKGTVVLYNSAYGSEQMFFFESPDGLKVSRKVFTRNMKIYGECVYSIAETDAHSIRLGDVVEGDRNLFPPAHKISIRKSLSTVHVLFNDKDNIIWFVNRVQ